MLLNISPFPALIARPHIHTYKIESNEIQTYIAMTTTSLIPLISFPLIISLFFLISPSYSSSDHKPYTSGDLVVEDKTRLGSMPPSCHNKCNLCHPCTAVQVPTMPSHHRVDPSSGFGDSAGNMYSNYKPLKWKCSCAGQFYNP